MRHTQLRSFHAVAQGGSFTRGARRLGVSQPTVTTQVKSLETEFGIELFLRRGRRIELTESGSGLLDITRRLFADEKEAADYLERNARAQDRPSAGRRRRAYHVTDMLAAFNARYPGLYVSVAVGNSRQTVRRSARLPHRRGGAGPCRSRSAAGGHSLPPARVVVAFCPADHAFARRRGIRLRELEGQRHDRARGGLDDAPRFRPGADARRVYGRSVVMEIGSRESIREAVAKGIGLGVVSEAEFIPDPRIRALPVTDAEIYTYAHVVHLSERQNARLVRAFLAVLKGLLAGAYARSQARSGLQARLIVFAGSAGHSVARLYGSRSPWGHGWPRSKSEDAHRRSAPRA